jgi:hypothetical protein
MAAPEITGLVALLESALAQESRSARAVDLKRAIVATARALPGATAIDQGAGVPNVGAAFRWLLSGHQSGIYHVEAAADGGNASRASGAYRRSGLASPADTIQRFTVTSIGGQSSARLVFRSGAAWLRTPAAVDLHGGPVTIPLTYDAVQLQKPGLYVGSVAAFSATDTLGGPLLWLTNTIIVPTPIEQPLKSRRTLAAGEVARYFVDLPAGAGGLTARLSVPSLRSSATLYLFEPDGMPYRGGGSADAGGKDSASVTLRVDANDVVPGVYEIAVQAPPNEVTSYALTVAVPPVAVADAGPRGAAIRNVTATPIRTKIEFDDDGALRDTSLTGAGAAPATVWIRSPAWADRMVVDVRFNPALWNLITDFGLTVFDTTGQQLSRGPMNYPINRQIVKIDSPHRNAPLEIELFPAFAHLRAEPSWGADVRIAFLRPAPRRLPAQDSSQVTIEAGGTVTIHAASDTSSLPADLRRLIRVRALPAGGPAAVRTESW